MPKREVLLAQESCVCDKIEQTYLLSEKGVTARVRKRENSDRCQYTHTEKIRLSVLTCIETERDIEEKEYNIRNFDISNRINKKIKLLIPIIDTLSNLA